MISAIPPVPVEWVTQGGAVGMLAIVAIAVFFGWLVPRKVYRDLERDRDFWRSAAMTAMGHTEALMPAATITAHAVGHLSAMAARDQATALPPAPPAPVDQATETPTGEVA